MAGSGEATLELKVVPDWTQFDNELKQREAKGINLRVNGIGGIGAGSSAAGGFGGSTSTDPNVRSAQGDQHLNQMLARATANREASSIYASSNGSLAIQNGLARVRRVYQGEEYGSMARPGRGYDFEGSVGGGGGRIGGGSGGGGGGGRSVNFNFGGGNQPASTFAAWNPRTRQAVGLSYDPGTGQFFNPQTGQGMAGIGWPGGGGQGGAGGQGGTGGGGGAGGNAGGGGGRGGGGGGGPRTPPARRNSLYDLIGRYAPAAIITDIAGGMLNAYQQGQIAQISAATQGPLASAQAEYSTTMSMLGSIPFGVGALSSGIYEAYSGSGKYIASQVAGQQIYESSFALNQGLNMSRTAAAGRISVAGQVGEYNRNIAMADATYQNEKQKAENATLGRIKDENAIHYTRRDELETKYGKPQTNAIGTYLGDGATDFTVEDLNYNSEMRQINLQQKQDVKAAATEKKYSLDKNNRDRTSMMMGREGSARSALYNAGLNPLGAKLQEIGTATNLGILASGDDPAAIAAYIKSGQDQAAAARQEYSHTINQDIIAFQSGGRAAIASANLNPIGSARSTMEGKLANIAANRPTNNAFGTAPETNRRLDAEAQAAKDDFTAAEINANRETRLNFAGSRSNLLAAALRPAEASALERQTSMNELNATLMSDNVGNGLTQAQIIAKLPAGSDYFTKKATIDNKFDTDKTTRDREYNIAGIGAAGEISANKFLMMGDPVSAINARAQADRDRINAQYAGDSPEAKAARDSLLTANRSNAQMDILSQNVRDRTVLQQSRGAVEVTGLEAKGKTYSAQVSAIKDATIAAALAIDPRQANAKELLTNVGLTGKNQEEALQRQMRYEMTIGPTKTASILNPYSLGPRGQAAVLRNEQPGEAIGGIKDAIATMQAAIVQAIHDLHGPPGAP